MDFGKIFGDILDFIGSSIDSQSARNASAMKRKLRSADDDTVRRVADNARSRGASGLANLADDEARRRGL